VRRPFLAFHLAASSSAEPSAVVAVFRLAAGVSVVAADVEAAAVDADVEVAGVAVATSDIAA
jgi:hypothetical protein